MRILRPILVALVIVLCLAIATTWARRRAAPVPQPVQSDPDVMGRRIRPLHLDNVPLSSAFARIADAADASLAIDWDALAIAGIKRDAPVTADLGDRPLREALDRAVDDASTSGLRAAYEVHDGVVYITTVWMGYYQTESHVYDLRDIIEGSIGLSREQQGKAAQLPLSIEECRRTARRLARSLVYEAVPDSNEISISEIAGRFVVTAPPKVHQTFAQRIQQWRAGIAAGKLPR